MLWPIKFKMHSRLREGMTGFRISLLFLLGAGLISMSSHPVSAQNNWKEVKVYQGKIDLPSYEFTGRELEPPLFSSSTVEGKYPLPQFIRPYKPGGPSPAVYDAIFLENEYLKLTVVPDFGGRVYSLYDKVNRREVFYKNDVLKFSGVNAKGAWPVGNIELTGPYDTHMMTLKGEPHWFTRVKRHKDGSASLVISSIDPFYRMKVNFTARLVPGLAAMELTIFCYNRRDTRKPYMFWTNAGVPVTRGSRFVYPMTRTIGHTTAEVASWPYYGGVDFSWFRNNKHMLGVFGIDIYDNFLGAYDHDADYGTFRFADRRVVTGMKTWTWGDSRYAERITRNYTDNAGPYIEIQSGRHVWDGHYEWLLAHSYEGWSEWWFPVADIGGFTTTSLDVALNLEVNADPEGKKSSVKLGLSANRAMPGATVRVVSRYGQILDTRADLAPGKPFNRTVSSIPADSSGLTGMRVTVIDTHGKVALDYLRPDESPGGKEYTPFTRQLEKPKKDPAQMSAEELVLDAETKIKEMRTAAGALLLRQALSHDSGHSRAHLNLGIMHYEQGQRDSAIVHLEKVIDRDPYADEAYYYLALTRMELGDTLSAERNLYYISRTGLFYSLREYMLGRIAWFQADLAAAERHFFEAARVNGYNLSARNLLALTYRLKGRTQDALAQIEEVEEIDPTNRWAAAERVFLSRDSGDRHALLALLGGQSQEALELAADYRHLARFEEALDVLTLVEKNNQDPYGTPPIFYYTKAYCLKVLGRLGQAAGYYRKGRNSIGNLDRLPFRPESVEPLAQALVFDPGDPTARFHLGCLLYHLGRREEAIYHWERGAQAAPDMFSLRRTLGIAYYENGDGMDKAAEHLEAAIKLNPDHVRTFTDLSYLYSREGYFDQQVALLRRALERSPKDDYIIEGLINANLVKGDYSAVDSLISSHEFAQRHRDYGLRDKYRFMRYGLGARAYQKGEYNQALRQIELALFPPGSLGADDFEFQSAPRLYYYLGKVLEKSGDKAQAKESFEKSIVGWDQLSGDRDSWNSENFYMALSLDRLGRHEGARKMLQSMRNFALSQMNRRYRRHRAQARYLLALVEKKEGNVAKAEKLFQEAVQLEPDMLGPRFELRRDVVDPLPQ